MTSEKRRGLPRLSKRTGKTSNGAPKKRWRGVIRTLLRVFVVWVGIVALGSTVFIGTRCYGDGTAAAAPSLPPGADGLPGYRRAEVFTYLTLPEWYIVYSADEYAAFIAQRPPSAFPYVGAVRQYWGHYSAVCAVTKREYPFEGGYHAMLGIIGASFTVEHTIKAAYENTIGRLTEWISSTETPEDAFARRVAREYGTFMHTVPWYEFPFGSRLTALWRETPFGGPNKIRKIERRMVLSMEYGAKAVYGWILGKVSGAAYGAEDLRIHARIANATSEVFADTRVKPVKPLGPREYLVTLPRYEEFTKAALAMNALGVRFVDIAGNDDILITVLARRGMSVTVPQARLIASTSIITDPTMQRLVFTIPVSALREVSDHLAKERAVIEHLYDY